MKIKPVHTTGDRWVVVIRDDIEPAASKPRSWGWRTIAARRKVSSGTRACWQNSWRAEFDMSGLFTGDELAEWAQPSEPEAGAGGMNLIPRPTTGRHRRSLRLWVIGGIPGLFVGDCT